MSSLNLHTEGDSVLQAHLPCSGSCPIPWPYISRNEC